MPGTSRPTIARTVRESNPKIWETQYPLKPCSAAVLAAVIAASMLAGSPPKIPMRMSGRLISPFTRTWLSW